MAMMELPVTLTPYLAINTAYGSSYSLASGPSSTLGLNEAVALVVLVAKAPP